MLQLTTTITSTPLTHVSKELGLLHEPHPCAQHMQEKLNLFNTFAFFYQQPVRLSLDLMVYTFIPTFPFIARRFLRRPRRNHSHACMIAVLIVAILLTWFCSGSYYKILMK